MLRLGVIFCISYFIIILKHIVLHFLLKFVAMVPYTSDHTSLINPTRRGLRTASVHSTTSVVAFDFPNKLSLPDPSLFILDRINGRSRCVAATAVHVNTLKPDVVTSTVVALHLADVFIAAALHVIAIFFAEPARPASAGSFTRTGSGMKELLVVAPVVRCIVPTIGPELLEYPPFSSEKEPPQRAPLVTLIVEDG